MTGTLVLRAGSRLYSIVFPLALLGGRASVASPWEEEKRDSCTVILELLPGAGSIKSDC